MANFLERPRQFNPYTAQIPVDLYTTIGLQKQEQYNQGVAKVQGYLDSLSGLPVARNVDKQYLNDKINQVTTKINEANTSDWSNQAIVNQVGALAASVYNDPILQNAVAGATKYQKDEQDIIQAKKDGKWSPENEWFMRKQMKDWFDAPSAGAEYSTYVTQPFKNFENVAADVIKQWKDVHPNSTLVQQPNGGFNAYVLTETGIKELNPKDVAEQINTLLTGSQKDQLAITGLYNNRNIVDAKGMENYVNSHFSKTEKYYDSLITSTKSDIVKNEGNADALADLKSRLAGLEKSKRDVLARKEGFKQEANTNADGVKSSLYYENWLNNVSEMIGYTESSQKIVDNPWFKASMDYAEHMRKLMKDQRDYEIDIMSLQARGAKKGAASSKDDTGGAFDSQSGSVLPQSEEVRRGLNLNDFKSRLVDMANQIDRPMMELLYRKLQNTDGSNPYINREQADLDGDGIFETDVYKFKQGKQTEALNTLASWKQQWANGDPNLPQEVSTFFENSAAVNNKLSKTAKVINDVEQGAEKYIKTLPEYTVAKTESDKFNALPSVRVGNSIISPENTKNYLKLLPQVAISTPSLGTGSPGGVIYGNPTDSQLKSANLTRQQWNDMRTADDPNYITPSTETFLQMTRQYQKTIPSTKRVEEEKNKFINSELRKYQGVFNEVAISVPQEKAEQVNRISNFVLSEAAKAQTSGLKGDTDWKSVAKMVDEDNRKGTQISYIQDALGNVRMRVYNPKVKKLPEEFTVDSQTARINQLQVDDRMRDAKDMMALNQGTTTGSSIQESLPLQNPNTGRYKINYNVESWGGKYKVILYVSDKKGKEVQGKEIAVNHLFDNWDQVDTYLNQQITEANISSELGVRPPSNNFFTGNMFQNPAMTQWMNPAQQQQPQQ